MGVKIKNQFSLSSYSLVIYFLIYINWNCDKAFMNCDLVQPDRASSKGLQLELSENYNLNRTSKMNSVIVSGNSSGLSINGTQLKLIVLDGLNMKRMPDMDRVSDGNFKIIFNCISQAIYCTFSH